MVLSATFEWLCPHAALIRLHPGEGAVYGDPYVWITAVKVHPGGLAEIKGADRPLPPGGAKAITSALRAAGFTRRRHERRHGGEVRAIDKDL